MNKIIIKGIDLFQLYFIASNLNVEKYFLIIYFKSELWSNILKYNNESNLKV